MLRLNILPEFPLTYQLEYGLIGQVVEIPFRDFRHTHTSAIAVDAGKALVAVPTQRDSAEVTGSLTQANAVAGMVRSRGLGLILGDQLAQHARKFSDNTEI